jgi:hypothetical protein
MTNEDGELLKVEQFHNMVEPGGDMYETAEECFGMIWEMAYELAEWRHGLAGRDIQPTRAQMMEIIRGVENNSDNGVEIGGVGELEGDEL